MVAVSWASTSSKLAIKFKREGPTLRFSVLFEHISIKMDERKLLLLCMLPLLVQNMSFLLLDSSGTSGDLSHIFNAIDILNRAITLVESNPHNFRVYQSPWWVAPRPTDLFNHFVLDAWPEEIAPS